MDEAERDSDQKSQGSHQSGGPSADRASDAEPLAPCASCGTTEPPDDLGLCSVKTCRAFRPGHSLSTKHAGRAKLTPADLAARDRLLTRLLVERGGRENLDIVSQLRIEDYATAQIQLGKVTRRLESLGAVSEAGNKRSSLVDTYNLFSARVERLASELPQPVTRTPATLKGVEQTPTSALEACRSLLQRLKAGETLSDFELGQLAVLRASLRGEIALRGELVPEDPPAAVIDVPASASVDPVATPDPAPEPRCPYCRQSFARCVETKTTHLDSWRVFHHDDPEEVTRRGEEATQVMLKMMRFGNPY